MECADIYQIAKNCRTSVEMIERFYAAHIKSTLDAAAINTLKPRTKPKATPKPKRKTVDEARPPRYAHGIDLGSRPELPAVSSETFSGSPSAPLAGSARIGFTPDPSAEGHPPSVKGLTD